jgi:hypothetical protein
MDLSSSPSFPSIGDEASDTKLRDQLRAITEAQEVRFSSLHLVRPYNSEFLLCS